MTSEITEILDRLRACEAVLEMHRGYLKAMEYALRVSFLTHQDPGFCSTRGPDCSPRSLKVTRDGGQEFAAAFQQSLTVLTEQIGAECNMP